MLPLLLTDFYKIGHKFQYPENTELVYSNFTARTSRLPNVDSVVFFGLQYFIKRYLIEKFNTNFFNKPLNEILSEYKRVVKTCLGKDLPNYEHIEALHNLGYLPIEIKALPEGVSVPLKVPMLTIVNTIKDSKFSWITNWVESLMSSVLWQAINSATIAREYKKILTIFANKTSDILTLVDVQAHDFSFRGMVGLEGAIISGMGHLTSFLGTDTIPAILGVEKYYNTKCDEKYIGGSVPATEHSVMCAGGNETELQTFKRLITEVYPNGIVSIVSDTWDLWKVLTEYLPTLKQDILDRDGTVVIRPDSGDPVDIICGNKNSNNINEQKGVIQLLWDTFGGRINEKGYKQLNSKVSAIYGDSITLERCETICRKLEEQGFASTNIVFGIGSFTYQYNTRDTLGMAMKATYVEINGKPFNIFKNPITDDGVKKSATGLLQVKKVNNDVVASYKLNQNCTKEEELDSELQTVFKDGHLRVDLDFIDIKNNAYIFSTQ